MEFQQKKPIVKKESEGCEIKVRRDNAGRVIGVKTNNQCSKSELELFRENIREKVENGED